LHQDVRLAAPLAPSKGQVSGRANGAAHGVVVVDECCEHDLELASVENQGELPRVAHTHVTRP